MRSPMAATMSTPRRPWSPGSMPTRTILGIPMGSTTTIRHIMIHGSTALVRCMGTGMDMVMVMDTMIPSGGTIPPGTIITAGVLLTILLPTDMPMVEGTMVMAMAGS